jgi:hypothetical protein
MVTGVLLAPTVPDTAVRNWVGRAVTPHAVVLPVLWYLGLNETYAGYLIAETPIVLPPGFVLNAARRREDQAARATYRALLPRFAELARRSWLSFLCMTALALTTFLWTNRRLPDRSTRVPAPSAIRSRMRRVAEQQTQDDPEAQAGFFFALQTLARSAPHRTILAVAVAAGLTHALLVLTQRGWRSMAIPATPLGVLAISPMLIGVSYAVTVPVEPAASWAIRMAWLGDERHYLAGVKRAAMLLVTALLILLLPAHVALLGVAIALVHTVLGLLFASVALDALFLPYRKMPFACSYMPIQNPKIVWPTGLASVWLVTYGFAAAERWALHTLVRSAGLCVMVGAIALFVRAIDRTRRRTRWPVSFDDRPAPATQRLGLFEHVTNDD